jgi:hypothetical protein
MKHIAPVFLALALVACDGAASSSSDQADADGFKAVPNIAGIAVKVPDTAIPNGVGGAPGFHSSDDSFGFTLQPMEASDTTDFEAAKKSAEELLFKKWITSEKTDDGWILTYESPKLDLSGEEAKEVGTAYSFEVRRKVGDQTLKCYGALDTIDHMKAAVDACKSLKTG